MNKIFQLKEFIPDIEVLRAEYNNVVELLEDKINPLIDLIVQRKFHIIKNNIGHPIIDSLPCTKKIVDKIRSKYNLRDVTYRLLKPGTSYNWHQDKHSFCCHIPLYTNDGCFFIYEHDHYKMPVGATYYVITGLPHTFVNAGLEPRIHITIENL